MKRSSKKNKITIYEKKIKQDFEMTAEIFKRREDRIREIKSQCMKKKIKQTVVSF